MEIIEVVDCILFIAEPIWRKTEQGKKEKRYKQFSIKI
jgi:hypothetical protein